MSMIKCPECGVAISSKAETCIRCGYPIAKYVAAKRAQASKQQAAARAAQPSPAQGNRQPLRIEQQAAAQANRQQAASRAPQPSPAQGNRQPLQIEKQAAAAANRQQAPQEQKQPAQEHRHHAPREQRRQAPPAQQPAAPAPQYAAAHSSASGGFNVKLLLVLILGILWMIMAEATTVLEIAYRLSPLYIVSYILTPVLLFCGMVLCVLKKRTPVIVLSAVALGLQFTLMVAICFVMSFSSVPRIFLSSLFPALMLIYAVLGRNRNSPIWMLIYIGIFLMVQLVSVLVFFRPYFWIPGGAFWIIYIPAQILEIHFFGIGYSPDNWYRRSSRQVR